MNARGRALRDRAGDPVARPVATPIGRLAVRPMTYGEARRWYDNWPESEHDDPARRASIFRRAFPGCEVTAPDVLALRVGYAAWLETVVLVASGMGPANEDADTDDEDRFAKPADYEAPEHSLMGRGAQPTPRQDLSEYRESDTIDALHERGYRYESIYRLLLPELEELTEGIHRRQQREQRERRKRSRKAKRRGKG